VRIFPVFLISAAALSLAGCGSQVSAPTLMPRAVEKQPIDLPVSEAVERETPADPALQTELSKQMAAAEAGDKAFMEQRAATEIAVTRAAGAAPGGEDWVQAQEGITSLETARTAVRDAAVAVDALRSNPAYAGTGSRAAIDAAAAKVDEMDKAEAAAIAALAAKLG
jgi:hypothetical protein